MSAARLRLVGSLAVVAALLVAGCSGLREDTAGASGTTLPDAVCAGPRTASTDFRIDPLDPPTPSLPVTVTDSSGSQVTITDASRILALDTYGTLGTTVYALGLGDRMVGRDISTGLPEVAHLPVVTHNGHELNAEAILNLSPTVVLTDYSIGPLEVQLQLKDSGIPVVFMDDTRNREVVGEQIRKVGEALGVAKAGEQLATQVEAEIAEAVDEVAELFPEDESDRIRMVFLYMRGNAGIYYWFGEGSGADDLIEALGGIDVAAETGLEGHRPLNAEGLVKAEPDMYLMMTHGLESVGGIDGMLDVPGVAETSAGQNRCVVDMDDSQILSFGPQFPATLRALAQAIYQPSTAS